MIWRRAVPLLAPALLLAALVSAPPSASAQVVKPVIDQQALVFLVDRVSFEELLSVPEIQALARAGGAALMTSNTVPGDQGPGAYLTLGTGVRSAGPDPRVLGFDGTETFRGIRADEFYERRNGHPPPLGPWLLDIDRYREANDGRAIPGLLGSLLQERGRNFAVFANSDARVGRSRPGILVAMNRRGHGTAGRLGFGRAPALGVGSQPKLLLDRPRPDALGGFQTDPASLTFVVLGARLPNPSPYIPSHLTVIDLGDTHRIDTEAPFASPPAVARQRREALAQAGLLIRTLVERTAAPDVLVIVVAPSPSTDMDRVKDELTPIVIARGEPGRLFPEIGRIRTLTSDTTRMIGVVSNEDVAPTILSFFGIRVPAEMNGSPIERSYQDAPFELHRRHLLNRRMTVPVQAGAGVAVTVAGLVAILMVALRRRIPRPVGLFAPVLVLFVPALAVALFAAGDLPTLTYGEVVPMLVAASVGGALLLLPLRLLGPLVPAAAAGLGVLVYFVLEAHSGWTTIVTPLLGASALDGVRFYGLPNVTIGLLLGSAVYLATRLPSAVGFVILVFVGLFIGLPDIGANFGGALTLFTAAGLWLALRVRGRLGWTEAALAVLVVVVGMVLVLLAHAFLADTPTHGSRFVEGAGPGPLSLAGEWIRRLGIGWRLLIDVPLAFIPVLGLPVLLFLVLRPPAATAESLARHPAWRDGLVVIIVASVVAFLANDTGPAAAALGFGMALGGLLYLPLVEGPWRTKPA